MAPLSDNLRIFNYIVHYFCPAVYSNRWCLHQALTARGGMWVTVLQMQTPNLQARAVWDWVFFSRSAVGLLARLTPVCCSDQVLYKDCEAPEQMRCLLFFAKTASVYCACTLCSRNTQCSYNLTLAEHWGCCQNLFNSSTPPPHHPPRCITYCKRRATLNNIGSVSWHTVTYCNYLYHRQQ